MPKYELSHWWNPDAHYKPEISEYYTYEDEERHDYEPNCFYGTIGLDLGDPLNKDSREWKAKESKIIFVINSIIAEYFDLDFDVLEKDCCYWLQRIIYTDDPECGECEC